MKQGGFKDLSSMIRAAIVMFVILSLGGGIMLWAGTENKIGRCEYTVLANDKLQNIELNCPAPFEIISGKNAFDLMKGMSSQMKTCWRKMGRGTKAPFGKNFATADDYCIVCSEFTIPQAEKYHLMVPDMVQFLSTETLEETNQYYTDYLDIGLKKWYNSNSEIRKRADEQIFNFVGKETNGKYDGVFLSDRPSAQGNDREDIHYIVVYTREQDFGDTWVGGISEKIFLATFGGLLPDKTVAEAYDRMKAKGYHMLYVLDEKRLDKLTCDFVYWKKDE